MKRILYVWIAAVLASPGAFGGDVELGGMKSKPPEGWKEEKPSNVLRKAQYKLPKAEGDPDDAELAVFSLSGSGTVAENLKRQLNSFKPADGKTEPENTVGKIMVGNVEATYQDVKGAYLSKVGGPLNPNAKTVEKPDYRQLYVLFSTMDGDCYFRLLGPAKTVEKHKKEFEEFLKNFK
jgi:hypothetical protein